MDLTDGIPYSISNNEIIKQISRCSHSVAAYFRATRRAKSTADFLHKYKIVEEEIDEPLHFLEILKVRCPKHLDKINYLLNEYEILLRVVVKSIITLKEKSKN